MFSVISSLAPSVPAFPKFFFLRRTAPTQKIPSFTADLCPQMDGSFFPRWMFEVFLLPFEPRSFCRLFRKARLIHSFSAWLPSALRLCILFVFFIFFLPLASDGVWSHFWKPGRTGSQTADSLPPSYAYPIRAFSPPHWKVCRGPDSWLSECYCSTVAANASTPCG